MAFGAELPVFCHIRVIVRAWDAAQKKIRCDLHLCTFPNSPGHTGDFSWMAEEMPSGIVGTGPVAPKPFGDGLFEKQTCA